MKRKAHCLYATVWVCICLGMLVCPLSVYATGEIVSWDEWVLPDQPLTNLTQIVAGNSHSLGLKVDGSVVAWGSNNDGQCTVPSPNTDFTAIAAGYGHSLGLKKRACGFTPRRFER